MEHFDVFSRIANSSSNRSGVLPATTGTYGYSCLPDDGATESARARPGRNAARHPNRLSRRAVYQCGRCCHPLPMFAVCFHDSLVLLGEVRTDLPANGRCSGSYSKTLVLLNIAADVGSATMPLVIRDANPLAATEAARVGMLAASPKNASFRGGQEFATINLLHDKRLFLDRQVSQQGSVPR